MPGMFDAIAHQAQGRESWRAGDAATPAQVTRKVPKRAPGVTSAHPLPCHSWPAANSWMWTKARTRHLKKGDVKSHQGEELKGELFAKCIRGVKASAAKSTFASSLITPSTLVTSDISLQQQWRPKMAASLNATSQKAARPRFFLTRWKRNLNYQTSFLKKPRGLVTPKHFPRWTHWTVSRKGKKWTTSKDAEARKHAEHSVQRPVTEFPSVLFKPFGNIFK